MDKQRQMRILSIPTNDYLRLVRLQLITIEGYNSRGQRQAVISVGFKFANDHVDRVITALQSCSRGDYPVLQVFKNSSAGFLMFAKPVVRKF